MSSFPSTADTAPRHRIGEAAARCGLSATSIRHYEREGLLPPQTRADNDYRLYSDADLHRLRFIRLCRAMDMSLDEVRTLLALDLDNKAHCAAARQTLDAHLDHVHERLAELQALAQDLQALRGRCDGQGEHCRIIESLHRQADAPLPPAGPHPARRHV